MQQTRPEDVIYLVSCLVIVCIILAPLAWLADKLDKKWSRKW